MYAKLFYCSLSLMILSCNNVTEKSQEVSKQNKTEKNEEITTLAKPSQEFTNYWSQGKAEISAYNLEQARYGEIRTGNAVMIYVTEPFNSEKQVKADSPNSKNTPVLKLNTTKKFNTGIYPYSIMTSTFYPLNGQNHALKISNSVQEWCGQVYAQLNNKDQFEIQSYSYFESESDQKFSLTKVPLENELFTQIRLNPELLPEGKLQMIPNFSYLRLTHHPVKAYEVEIVKLSGTAFTIYQIKYPELNRTLSIQYDTTFPHTIEGWTETYQSGYGDQAKTLNTKATRKKTLLLDYWNKNSNQDEVLRKELMLD